MKKRLNKLFIKLENDHSNTKLCDEKDCNNPGEYEAPKSPNSSERYIFCLQHIKDYNKDGIFLLEKHRHKSMITKKMTFLKVDQQNPFQKVLVQK